VCFTRLIKKMERESLLMSALVLALKFRCLSKCMPRSLKDLRLGLAWEGVVDSLNFENKFRVEGSVRDVRIQH
jgi:hypothetical protein